MAGTRVATGPMRNPTAGPPQAGSDGRWTAREPVGWRDDAGRGRWEGATARDVARSRDATDPLARGGAEQRGRHPAVAASRAGDAAGGGADRSVRRGVDSDGPGRRAGGAAGGSPQGPGVPLVGAAAREDGPGRQRRAGIVWSDRTAAAVSAPESGGRSGEAIAGGAAWAEPEPDQSAAAAGDVAPGGRRPDARDHRLGAADRGAGPPDEARARSRHRACPPARAAADPTVPTRTRQRPPQLPSATRWPPLRPPSWPSRASGR
jgi:hypothetical protein